MRDLPGQLTMFPEDDPRRGNAGAEPPQTACRRSLALPRKATCTVGEAHEATGISRRQIRYYVEDGTLLAVNAARVPAGSAAGRGGRRNKIDRWRIVVRRSDDFKAENYAAFMTLEEFVRSRLNYTENE